jgi:hypothetical protein
MRGKKNREICRRDKGVVWVMNSVDSEKKGHSGL